MSDEKLDELIEVLRKHLAKAENIDLVTNATLLKLSVHGGNFVERVPSKVQSEVKKALRILNKIEAFQHFERKNINNAIRSLEIVATAETLHGSQHTTRHRDKVAFAVAAARLWTRHMEKEQHKDINRQKILDTNAHPYFANWLGDTHPYSKFLTDLINILEPDWTARMVIAAFADYEISKNTE
jgi:hypothetical protein